MPRFGSPTIWPFWTRVSVIRPFSSTIAALRIRWPSRVTVPLASRVWAVLLASKEKLRPPICGNWPGVAPALLAETACSRIRFISSAETVVTASALLKRSELVTSSCEMSPDRLPAEGLAAGGNSAVPPPAVENEPIESRMPPPFLIETATVGSYCLAYQRLASAERSPRLVSSVRTSPRRPSR